MLIQWHKALLSVEIYMPQNRRKNARSRNGMHCSRFKMSREPGCEEGKCGAGCKMAAMAVACFKKGFASQAPKMVEVELFSRLGIQTHTPSNKIKSLPIKRL